MRFRKWLLQFENLSGPGGGGTLVPAVGDVEQRAKEDAKLGVGALPTVKTDENPPSAGKSPLRRFTPRKMKKR